MTPGCSTIRIQNIKVKRTALVWQEYWENRCLHHRAYKIELDSLESIQLRVNHSTDVLKLQNILYNRCPTQPKLYENNQYLLCTLTQNVDLPFITLAKHQEKYLLKYYSGLSHEQHAPTLEQITYKPLTYKHAQVDDIHPLNRQWLQEVKQREAANKLILP